MARRSADPAAIEAEVDHVRSLGIDALRTRWRSMFGATPPAGLTKDIIARMIAYRIQEEAFGGLDQGSIKLLDRLARGDKPGEVNRRLKPGTVLVREYKGERHTVTVVPDGFLWQETTYAEPFDHRAHHHRHSLEWASLLRAADARRQGLEPTPQDQPVAAAHHRMSRRRSSRSRAEPVNGPIAARGSNVDKPVQEAVPLCDLHPQIDRA